MKTLDLGRFRRARVWIGELPDAAYSSINPITHTVRAGGQQHGGRRLVAVELFVPLGARSMYGLIGGLFEPWRAGQLTVEVSSSSNSERLLTDSLASGIDEVRVGLPAEYIAAILRGVDAVALEVGGVASGKLVINCGAYGVVGSCQAIYESLAATLVKLCNIATNDVSDSELIRMFPPELHG